MRLRAVVTDAVRPGVLASPKGRWSKLSAAATSTGRRPTNSATWRAKHVSQHARPFARRRSGRNRRQHETQAATRRFSGRGIDGGCSGGERTLLRFTAWKNAVGRRRTPSPRSCAAGVSKASGSPTAVSRIATPRRCSSSPSTTARAAACIITMCTWSISARCASRTHRITFKRIASGSFSVTSLLTSAPRWRCACNQVASLGLPNYFDDQRFGSVTDEGGEFIGRLLVRGQFEAALKLALAAPYEHDRAEQKARNASSTNTGATGRHARN